MPPFTALVVDDDPPLLLLATRILSADGFDVLAAPSAEQALATATTAPALDLLFTDVVLPGRSGLELAATLRLARPDLPVLVTTGEWQGATRDAIERSGHPLIRKPYDVATVLAAVQRVLPHATLGSIGTR